MSNIVHEENGGLLRDDAIAVFVFQHAVNLATGLTHVNQNGETKPTKSSKQDCKRRVIEKFWKLAHSELGLPPA